jgi:arylsulfatase A-like enzyme
LRLAVLGLPLLGLAAAVLAWRMGGGADARVAPPAATASSGANTRPGARVAEARGAEAYEVKTHLVDALGEAHIDVPNLASSQAAFQSYWRKMRGPWSRPSGIGASLVTTIALRTSEEETQWAVTGRDGGTWAPEARVWNMNEGSYDQREAIFAPAPATLSFRMTLPPRARLRAAAALAAPATSPAHFEITVVDAAGAVHTVSETDVAADDAHLWHEVDVDLSAWGAQPIELVLRTVSDPSATGGAPLALWGDPVILAAGPTHLPYNVLWVVVDALRPDVAAALHDADDDRAKLEAPRAPLETLLPVVPGLMPSIDGLAARGVHFQHAWSAAAWTRPGTIAMLSGERSSEIGLDTTAWVLPPGEAARYYASDPPLLPLLLRKSGASTAAFVNNFFMSGYSAVGVDMGFERLTDHRYRTRDTDAIAQDALAWLEAHNDERFFLFANFNSPHEPYDPVPDLLARIPKAPGGVALEPEVRSYMAEGAKDDAAIGLLLAKIEALGLTKSTLVVVTSDHGETLSSAHDAVGLGRMPMRFHHAVGNYEETTRIPIVMALPAVLDGGAEVLDRVRNVDIAPTVLDVEGLEADPRMSGRSMLPLARGKHEPEPRVVLNEGRGSRAVLWGNWRLVVHDPPSHTTATARSESPLPGPLKPGSLGAGAPAESKKPTADGDPGDAPDEPKFEDELYDLTTDPGERRNVAHQHPDVVAELRARLAAGLANTPAADAPATAAAGPPSTLRIRFAGAGQVHRIAGTLTVGDGKHAVTVTVEPAGIAREALRVQASSSGAEAPAGGPATTGTAAGPRQVVDFALTTSPDAALGFDVKVDPPGAPITWRLFLDDAPWPQDRTFGGPFGLPAVAAREGITSEDARDELYAQALPTIDPARDLGVFLTRDRLGAGADGESAGPSPSPEAAKEMQRMLQQWGYAHKGAAPAASTPGEN